MLSQKQLSLRQDVVASVTGKIAGSFRMDFRTLRVNMVNARLQEIEVWRWLMKALPGGLIGTAGTLLIRNFSFNTVVHWTWRDCCSHKVLFADWRTERIFVYKVLWKQLHRVCQGAMLGIYERSALSVSSLSADLSWGNSWWQQDVLRGHRFILSTSDRSTNQLPHKVPFCFHREGRKQKSRPEIYIYLHKLYHHHHHHHVGMPLQIRCASEPLQR